MDLTLLLVIGGGGLVGFLLVYRSVRNVPRASVLIIERFGKYRRSLHPGLNVTLPFFDVPRHSIDLREQVVSFPPQLVASKDDVQVEIGFVLYFQVTDPVAAVYEVANFLLAIEQLAVTMLRNVYGEHDFGHLNDLRGKLNTELRNVLDEGCANWGIRVNRAEVKDIQPPDSLAKVLEEQQRIERDNNLAIMKAEGERKAAIIAAEGQRQAILIAAEAQREAAQILAAKPVVQDDPRPRVSDLLPGDLRQIGPYTLTGRLGERVYLGEDPEGSPVSVRLVAKGEKVRVLFEAPSAWTARVIMTDLDGDLPYIASEYIPAFSLRQIVGADGPLVGVRLETLAVGIAVAVTAIHGRNIVHGNLGPDTVLVTPGGPRLVDFSLASGRAPGADLNALGRLIVFAGTGEEASRGARVLPAALRSVVASCLEGRASAGDVLLGLLR